MTAVAAAVAAAGRSASTARALPARMNAITRAGAVRLPVQRATVCMADRSAAYRPIRALFGGRRLDLARLPFTGTIGRSR
jgi:hypothetical protein